MNNYPPGVTGNEFHIAGPTRERLVDRVCGTKNVMITALDTEILRELRGAYAQGGDMNYAMRAFFADGLHEVDVDECPFDDGVEVYESDGALHWSCPLCESPHVEEPGDTE